MNSIYFDFTKPEKGCNTDDFSSKNASSNMHSNNMSNLKQCNANNLLGNKRKNLALNSNSTLNIDINRANLQPNKKKTKITCKCRNSKCLKEYCDCFAADQFCIDCYCFNCKNTAENIEIVRLLKSSKKKAIVEEKFNGCHCTNSQCQKKYCECFKANTICTEKCRCINCLNDNNNTKITDYVSSVKREESKFSLKINNVVRVNIIENEEVGDGSKNYV